MNLKPEVYIAFLYCPLDVGIMLMLATQNLACLDLAVWLEVFQATYDMSFIHRVVKAASATILSNAYAIL